VATLPYAAPEILEDGVLNEYDESVDWWSLGATIVTLVTGEVRFLNLLYDPVLSLITNAGSIRCFGEGATSHRLALPSR
jgi:serine/threonine protein kinase